MKILKIFGIVMAIHAFAFVLIFANPGCSSTTKNGPASGGLATAPSRPAADFPAASANAPIIVATPSASRDMSTSTGGFDPNAPAVAPSVRYTPTRPGTPEASAVQVQPVANVVPASTYAVASGDSLWTLAKKNHLTVAELTAANNLKANATLKPGQKLIIPAKSSAPAAASAAADGTPLYKVKSGDKLSVIAKRAGTTTTVLKELNGLKSDTVRAGQDLKLPAGTTMAEPAPTASVPSAVKPSGDAMTYVVKPGESLSTIARELGVKQSDIIMANNITNPAVIKAGTTLTIPGWKAAPKSAKTTGESATTNAPEGGQDTAVGLKPESNTDIPVIKIEEPAGATKNP